jgi:hypothetical protein
MSSPDRDYDLLLEAPSAVDAALAKDLLEARGIPSFTQGRDRDLAELGAGVHNALTRPDLYVPKGMREKARAVLDEAWSAERLEDPPLSADDAAREREVVVAAESEKTRRGWIAILGVIALLAVVLIVVLARNQPPSDGTREPVGVPPDINRLPR